MRHLILSDIHGNWEALQAVLAEAAGAYDNILCCGDIVGYGADPNRCVDWVRANVAAGIRGNHDRACCGMEDLEWFNPFARASAVWTREELTSENFEYLRALERGPKVIESGPVFQILHGSPADEDEYVVNTFEASQLSGYLDFPLSFFGHTHVQGGFWFARSKAKAIGRVKANETSLVVQLDPKYRYLLNPGSVGQPRDTDPRAAFAVYDGAAATVTYHRVVYDIDCAQRRIRAAGLPPILADRLAIGK